MARVKYRGAAKVEGRGEEGGIVAAEGREVDKMASLHSFLAIVARWRSVSLTDQVKRAGQ